MKDVWVFLVVFLGCCVSGCSGYQQGALPTSSSDYNEFETAEPVSKGSNVRVTLQSGEFIAGVVAWVSDKEIAVSQVEIEGAPVRVVKVSDCSQIEVKKKTSTTTIVFASVVGLAVLYAVVEGVKGWSMW